MLYIDKGINVQQYPLSQENSKKFKEDRNSEKEIFYEEIKPVFIILKVYGAFPISKISPGNNQFKIFSCQMMYSLLFFISMGTCGLMYSYYANEYSLGTGKSSKNYTLIFFSFSSILFHSAVIVCHYVEAPRVAEYMNNWWKFQILYGNIMKRPLMFNLYKRSFGGIIAIIISAAVTCFISRQYYGILHHQLYDMIGIIVAIYTMTFAHTHILLWSLKCQMLIETAIMTIEDFEKRVLMKPSSSCDLLKQHRKLWYDLAKLTKQTGDSCPYTMGIVIFSWFVVLLYGIYMILMGLISHNIIFRVQLYHFFHAVFVLLLFYLFCNLAHKASKQVGDSYQYLICSSLSSKNHIMENELSTFLQIIIANSPHIGLSGYFTVNRSLLISILSTIVTYLVVSLQFSTAERGEYSENNNVTTIIPTETWSNSN